MCHFKYLFLEIQPPRVIDQDGPALHFVRDLGVEQFDQGAVIDHRPLVADMREIRRP